MTERDKQFKSLFEYYGFTDKDKREFPVICEILKNLTPEIIEREIEKISKVKFPSDLWKWIEEYNKNIGERSLFLWQWLYTADLIGLEPFNFPSKYSTLIEKAMVLINMFINLIDDASEKNKKLLNELLKIPFAQKEIKFHYLDSKEKRYLKFTKKIWNEIERTSKETPNFKKMKEIFEFDISQLLNTTFYSSLMHRYPFFLNPTEYWLHLPQNMQFIFALDFTLMCTKSSFHEEGRLREIIFFIQKMARIGNDIGTWEREIRGGDFVNGIWVHFLAQSNNAYLSSSMSKLFRRQKKIFKLVKELKIERVLLKEWERNYQKVERAIIKSKLINKYKLLVAIKKITAYHLIGKSHI